MPRGGFDRRRRLQLVLEQFGGGGAPLRRVVNRRSRVSPLHRLEALVFFVGWFFVGGFFVGWFFVGWFSFFVPEERGGNGIRGSAILANSRPRRRRDRREPRDAAACDVDVRKGGETQRRILVATRLHRRVRPDRPRGAPRARPVLLLRLLLRLCPAFVVIIVAVGARRGEREPQFAALRDALCARPLRLGQPTVDRIDKGRRGEPHPVVARLRQRLHQRRLLLEPREKLLAERRGGGSLGGVQHLHRGLTDRRVVEPVGRNADWRRGRRERLHRRRRRRPGGGHQRGKVRERRRRRRRRRAERELLRGPPRVRVVERRTKALRRRGGRRFEPRRRRRGVFVKRSIVVERSSFVLVPLDASDASGQPRRGPVLAPRRLRRRVHRVPPRLRGGAKRGDPRVGLFDLVDPRRSVGDGAIEHGDAIVPPGF